MLFFWAGIHKNADRIIANREDPDQTDLGLHCVSRLVWQATSVRNFTTFTVPKQLTSTQRNSFSSN